MNDTERELRDAVRSYAEDVQPADRLGEIRRATAARPRRTRTWLLVGGVALASAAVVLGFAVLVGPGGDDGEPVAATTDVTVYEVGTVGGQPWLYPEQVSVDDTGDPVYDALAAQLSDGRAACPTGELQAVDVSPGLVTVRAPEAALLCPSGGVYAAFLQQLAWTVHDARRQRRPGAPGEDRPATDDHRSQRAVAGAARLPRRRRHGRSPLTVEGRGNTFEGNVQWQVLSGDDVVDKGFETAGTMGDFRPFSFTVDLEPGDYTVRVFALSMEDGSLFAEDTASITVD